MMSKSSKVQTDNSFFAEKVKLRLDSLKEVHTQVPSVLECFGGDGLLWKEVSRISGRKINSLRIDQKKDKDGSYLCGNNLKILPSLNLADYDIIDLDAYGIPWDQLALLKAQDYSGVIHITHIQTMMGALPYNALEHFGISHEMFKKSPTIYANFGGRPVKSLLYEMGYRKIYQYAPTSRKIYFWTKKDLL